MPPQPGKVGTPEAINQFDALLALGLKINAASLQGVDRLAVVARWGVGYDMIDVDALTAADVALAITPNAVRRPVAEAIITFIFALSTNLLQQDRVLRSGGWRGNLTASAVTLRGGCWDRWDAATLLRRCSAWPNRLDSDAGLRMIPTSIRGKRHKRVWNW